MNVEKNLAQVKQNINNSLALASRGGPIKIVAVTKTFDVPIIKKAIQAGVTAIGENIVQDAARKKELLKEKVEWHMVGHLQSNKARKAVEIFDWIQTVDSIKIAERLENACSRIGEKVNVLVQVNISGEGTKYGVSVEESEALVNRIKEMNGLKLRGLMTIAPYFEHPEFTRPFFKQARELKEKLNLEILSMGMTNDYQTAVEEGATMIRVGTAIFGSRGA